MAGSRQIAGNRRCLRSAPLPQNKTTLARQSRIAFACLGAGMTIAGSQAYGQTLLPPMIEPKDTAGNREIPGYEQIDYDLAGFDVLPGVTFGSYLDDNVFSRDDIKEADVSFSLEPKVALSRQSGSTDLRIDAQARQTVFARLSSQDATEYSLAGKIGIGRDGPNTVTFTGGYRREVINRGNAENDISIGSPLTRQVLDADLLGHKQFNRLAFTGRLHLARLRYDDIALGTGNAIDQNFRNGEQLGADALVNYEISPQTGIFAAVGMKKFDYRQSPTLGNRDAVNWTGTMGVNLDFGRLLLAQVAVGYRRYDFTDSALPDNDGIAISARLRYYPTPLLTLGASIEQVNSTSSFDQVAAVTLTKFRIESEYEMRRNLSWHVEANFDLEEYELDDYGTMPRTSSRLGVSAGPVLRLSRHLTAEGEAGYIRRFVSATGPIIPFSKAYARVSIRYAF